MSSGRRRKSSWHHGLLMKAIPVCWGCRRSPILTATVQISVQGQGQLTVQITGAPATTAEGVPIALGSTITDPAPGATFSYAWEVRQTGVVPPVATGTGYTGQYRPPVAKMYESLATCPDELLLFFHHVPYTYKLHSGKTVIQTIYDGHYEGASKAHDFVTIWKSLKGRLDYERFDEVLAQLEYQSGHAIVWRDAINDWFHRISGIADEKGRVAHHPNRVEAEAMELKGYESFEPASWEGASGGAGEDRS